MIIQDLNRDWAKIDKFPEEGKHLRMMDAITVSNLDLPELQELVQSLDIAINETMTNLEGIDPRSREAGEALGLTVKILFSLNITQVIINKALYARLAAVDQRG